MSEPPKRMHSTTPPPADADDLYGASTVVGQASAELLALMRSAEEGVRPEVPRPAGATHHDAPTSRPPAHRPGSCPPAAPGRVVSLAPLISALPQKKTALPDEETYRRLPRETESPRRAPVQGLPPLPAIVLIFAAAALALAALIR